MAQEIVRWCDNHLIRHDEKVPGRDRTLTLDGVDYSADLCDPCDKEIFGPLRECIGDEILRKSGTAARGPINNPKDTSKLRCPETGCSYSAKSKTSFRTHMPDAHGVSLPVYEGRRGYNIEGEKITHYCDYGDCEGGFTTPQGKGAHMAAEHGYTGPTNQPALTDPEPEPARKTPAKKTAKKAS